jgi:uncharacterized membrane protein
MIHPATAHFAIVLPIVASLFGIVYLFTKSEGMSKISTRLTVFAALAMIAVWYTGSSAGPLIYDYLSGEGQDVLKDHKKLGLYLAIAMGIIALIKLIGCKTKKFVLEVLAIVLLLAVTGATLFQGKMGGEITFNYGMPFKAYMIEDSLKEASANAEEAEDDAAKVEVYEDAIDDIKLISEDVNKLLGVAKVKTEE